MRLDSELIALIKLGIVDTSTRIDTDGEKVVKVAGQPVDTIYRRYRRELKKYAEDNAVVVSLAQMDFDDPISDPMEAAKAEQMSEKLDTEQVLALLGISRSTLLRLRKTDDFPKAIQLNQRSQRWYRHELEAWERSRSRT